MSGIRLRSHVYLSLALAAVVGIGCGKRPPQADSIRENSAAADADRASFQGNWKHLSIVMHGKQATPEVTGEFLYRFDGNKYVNSRGGTVLSKGTFVLDTTKSPAWIDLAEDTGVRIHGIYQLDGDRLTLCLHEEQRPTKFESRPGQVRVLLVLEHLK